MWLEGSNPYLISPGWEQVRHPSPSFFVGKAKDSNPYPCMTVLRPEHTVIGIVHTDSMFSRRQGLS